MRKNKWLLISLLFVMLILISAGGYFYYFEGKDIKTEKISCEAVMAAVKEGKIEKLRDYKTSVNNCLDWYDMDNKGFSPLHVAVAKGESRIVEFLLDQGANIDISTSKMPMFALSPLHFAVIKENKEIIKLLINRGADINYYPHDGLYFYAPPLLNAVVQGNYEIARILLENGAKVDGAPELPATPLDFAYQVGFEDMVSLLKKYGGNRKVETNQYPLLGAVLKGDIDKIKNLINKGANVNDRPDTFPYIERTPLHFAAKTGNLEIIEILLDNGADVNIRSFEGTTPVYNAVKHGHNEAIKLLYRHGANLDLAAEGIGSTPLHSASYVGNLEAVKELVGLGAKVDPVNNAGLTPLFRAVENRNFKIAKYLINEGADPTRKYNVGYGKKPGADIVSGWTLLHSAAKNGDIETAKLLLDKGLDPGAKTKGAHKNRQTPIDWARISDRLRQTDEMIELLEKYD